LCYYGRWLRTDEDTIDRIGFTIYRKTTEHVVHLTAEMATMSVLSYDFRDFAAEIRKGLERLREMNSRIFSSHLSDLPHPVGEFAAAAKRLHIGSKPANCQINGFPPERINHQA
jgi:hypothetical protein